MKIEKIRAQELEKCYSIAPLRYKGKDHLLVAAEKVNKCMLFDLEGNLEETVWDGPGGTMSMVQVPGSDGVFLATHRFYSPNDSKEAMIVMASPAEEGWKVKTLAHLPHVHRFDILERNGVRYVIAATLCSGRKFKDDWSEPGKVYACELPEDLDVCDEDHPLPFTALKDGLLKNHGYCRQSDEKGDYAVIGADSGVFRFVPPEGRGGRWEITQLIRDPASDMTFVDFQENGEPDMLVMTPFHGETVRIYRMVNGNYELYDTYEKAVEFVHAVWGGRILGRPAAIIGHRKGDRDLLAFTYDKAEDEYRVQILDHDVGPANVLVYLRDGAECLAATNREIDEIAFYELSE